MQFQEMKRMIIPSPLCPRSDESLDPPKTASPSRREPPGRTTTHESISHPASLCPLIFFPEDTESLSVSSVVPYAVPFFIKLFTVPLKIREKRGMRALWPTFLFRRPIFAPD